MIMVKRFLTLFLLLSVVSVRAEKAPEKVVSVEEAMKCDQAWIMQDVDSDAPEFRGCGGSCKCKCYRCLRVGNLTVTGTETVATLNATNVVVSNDLTVDGVLTLDGLSVNALLAEETFANFYAASPVAAVLAGNPVIMPTAGPASVAPAGVITYNGSGSYVLPAVGVYEVSWNLVAGAAAVATLELQINTVQVPGSVVSVTAVAGGTELSSSMLVQTTAANSLLRLFSSTGIATFFGTASAQISIRRVS
jgi:hypothetical protein